MAAKKKKHSDSDHQKLVNPLLKDYVFSLHGILSHDDSRECFRKFLTKELNIEPLQFLESLEILERLCTQLPSAKSNTPTTPVTNAGYLIDNNFTNTTEEKSHLSETPTRESVAFASPPSFLAQPVNITSPTTKVLDLVKDILNSFIKSGSKKEINISAKDKQDLYTSFILPSVTTKASDGNDRNNSNKNVKDVGSDEINESIDLIKLSSGRVSIDGIRLLDQFKNVRLIVEREMTCDVLPRFLRSDLWMALIVTHGDSLIKRIGKHRKAVEMSYEEADFVNHLVEERDVEFLRELAEDSYDWKLIGFDPTQKIMAFRSKHILNYFPDVSWLSNGGACSKYVGILDFPFETCVHYLMHAKYVSQFDGNVTHQETLEYYTYEQLLEKYPGKDVGKTHRTCAVMNYDLKFPFPLAPRVYTVATSGMYDEEKKEVIAISKPCYHPSLDSVNKKKVCLFKDLQLYTLKKLDDQRTLYFQIHITNMGSVLGNKLSQLVMFHRGKQLSSNITKFLKSRKDKEVPPHDPNDGLMKPYLDHREYLEQLKQEQELSENTASSAGHPNDEEQTANGDMTLGTPADPVPLLPST